MHGTYVLRNLSIMTSPFLEELTRIFEMALKILELFVLDSVSLRAIPSSVNSLRYSSAMLKELICLKAVQKI